MRGAGRAVALLALMCSDQVPAASKPKPKLNEADQARETMRIYSRCLVKTGRVGSAHVRLVRFLSQSADEQDGGAAVRAVARPECLQEAATVSTYVSKLRFQPSLLRGEVFRALYFDRLAQPDRLRAVQPSEIAGSWSGAADSTASTLRNLGDCVVAIDHTGADAAVRADVASEAETTAYRGLGPALSRCISSSQTLHFSRAVLQGVLSEALYRQSAGVVSVATTTEAK